ncbi:hypothetical protein BDW75DRAFT_226310 [Aspergillus navahoensis]
MRLLEHVEYALLGVPSFFGSHPHRHFYFVFFFVLLGSNDFYQVSTEAEHSDLLRVPVTLAYNVGHATSHNETLFAGIFIRTRLYPDGSRNTKMSILADCLAESPSPLSCERERADSTSIYRILFSGLSDRRGRKARKRRI